MLGDGSKIFIYRVVSDCWEKYELSVSSFYVNLNCKAVFLNDHEILLTGGANEASAYLLNLKTLKITAKKPMNFARDNHGIIYYKNRVFVLGGYCFHKKDCITKCEVYDVEKDRWDSIKDMNFKRKNFGVCLIQNEFFKK